MDKYDQTMRKVIAGTQDNEIKWKSASPNPYHRIITNVDMVVRCFTAKMTIKDSEYDLVFVEKKTFAMDENGIQFEKLGYELNVLNDGGELVVPIYEGLVDREDLFRLASVVSDSNADANDFFDALLGDDE